MGLVRPVKFSSIFLVLLALLFSSTVSAQILTGSIGGTVTDTSGAAMPDVKVTTTSPALIGGSRTVNSDASGNYKFLELPPGTYAVRFEKQGFKSFDQENIVINTGVQVTVSPNMAVGDITQAVTVEAAAATIDVEHVTLQDVATQAKMEDIPNGRSPWAIANTIASVVAAGAGVGAGPFDVGGSNGMQQVALSSHGSNPSADQKFVIDGVSVNWPGGGGGSTLMYYDMGMFQEVNYIVGAEPADVSQGGVYMNMVTGDGGNQFHGRVFMNGASQSMQSNNVGPALDTELLNNLSATTRSLINLSKVVPGTPITETYDYNGQVGGPIIKDKLWFFTSWRLWATNNLSAAFNSNGTQALNDNQIADEMGKFSYQINPKNRLSVMYFRNQKNRYHRRLEGVFGDNVTTSLQNQPAYDSAMRYTLIPSASWVVDAGFALTAGKTPYRYQNDITPGAISVYDTTTQTIYNAAEYNYLNPVYRGALDVSAGYFNSNWAGRHNIKFGFQDSQDGYNQRYTANGDLQGQLLNGVPTTALLYNTPINIQKNNLEITAFYAMDSWTIKKRLTINYGLRWERYYAWIPAQTSPAGTFVGARSYPQENGVPNWNNWTPRLGFAYDVTGRQKTVIKGSVSRYMQGEGSSLWTQVNPLGLSTGSVTWNCPTTQYAQCIADGPTMGQLNLSSFTGFTGGLTTHISSPSFCTSQGFPSSECPTLQRPHAWEYSFGVQQELPLDIVFSATAWYRATYDQIGRENLDVPFNSYIPVSIKNPLTGAPLTVYNQAPSTKGMVDYILLNSSLLNQYYHGLDLTFQRRMMRHFMFFGGFTYGHVHGPYTGDINTTLDDLNNPNNDYNRVGYLAQDATVLFKLGGVVNLWKGITLAPNFQHYTGFPEIASYTVTGPIIAAETGASSYTLTQNTQNIYVQPPGFQRLPSANLLDLRLSKVFAIKERYKLEPEFDIYNLTNASVVTAVQTSVTAGTATGGTGSVGSLFLNPTSVIPPRLYKVGLRFDF